MENEQTRRPDRSIPPQVVIVGGGFGGLYAARALGRARVRVTLVDRQNFHLFRPLLYQVATGLLSADEIAAPIRSILRRQKNTDVLMAEVTGVDTQNRRVLMGPHSLPYDYLILATGVHYSYFGHDEWKEYAASLTSVGDADRIRAMILRAFEAAERLAADPEFSSPSLRGAPGLDDPPASRVPGGAVVSAERAGRHREEIEAWLTFVLVGGGPTGVELAGAIADLSRRALVGDFRHVDPRQARILLFEASPRILGTFPADLAERARRRLEQMGVEARTGSAVEQVDAEGVTVGGQHISSRTVLWAAGVAASPGGQWLGAEVDRAGRVKVNPDFSVPGHPEVFVVGDTAALTAPVRDLLGRVDPQPRPLPGLAQPTIQGGEYVASVIRRRILGQPPPKPFVYKDKGSLAIVGRFFAIADLKFFRLWGWPAWCLWLGVHVFFLMGFANRLLVLTQWGISFLTNRRSGRILPSELEKAAADNPEEPAAVPGHDGPLASLRSCPREPGPDSDAAPAAAPGARAPG
jgi:NADH dehydrogenase